MGLENKAEIAAIISNPAARTSEKIRQLLSLGEVKIANEYGRSRAAHKFNKRTKEKIAISRDNSIETRRHNAATEAETKKYHEDTKEIAFNALAQAVSENAKNRAFKEKEYAKNRIAAAQNAITLGFSKLGSKSGLKAEDYLNLITDNTNAYHIVSNSGIPVIKIGKRSEIIPPKSGDALSKEDLEFLAQNGRI
jgi:hypothetical protein